MELRDISSVGQDKSWDYSKPEQTDLWAWHLGLVLGTGGIVVWAAVAPFLESGLSFYFLAAYFLVAAAFRGFYTLKSKRSEALWWSAMGSFLFATLAVLFVFLPMELYQALSLFAAVMTADGLIGLFLASKHKAAFERIWLLGFGPATFISGLVAAKLTSVTAFETFASFLIALTLCLHSVVTFSLFLHVKKNMSRGFPL